MRVSLLLEIVFCFRGGDLELKNTFAKGIHPPGMKELSKDINITEMPAPKTVYIPVVQHIGAKPEIVVKAGQAVHMGQLIAKASGAVSTNIFSSVSGTVKPVQILPLPNGEKAEHIVIENDFSDKYDKLPKLSDPTREQLLQRIRDCGIVGMGGAGFPTDIKMKPQKPVDILLINGAECEPYITCDYRIMLEYTEQLVKGIAYLMKALNVEKAVIGIEDNKPEAIKRIDLYLSNNNITSITTMPLAVKYPQGAEKQLIYAVTKRKVFNGGLPSDVGVVVQNIHTALSTYFAVWDGQTLFRRVVTVTGGGIKKPGNFWIRNGTPVLEIIKHVGYKVENEEFGAQKEKVDALFSELVKLKEDKQPVKEKQAEFKQEREKLEQMQEDTVAKVINGGPMMGAAMSSLETASSKIMSCVLLLNHKEASREPITQCINCAKCAYVCPMNLMPMYIDAYELNKDWANAKKYGAMDCIQCGCCAYICPAKKPLVQSIAYSKKMIKANKI